jgi:hypothetical protein
VSVSGFDESGNMVNRCSAVIIAENEVKLANHCGHEQIRYYLILFVNLRTRDVDSRIVEPQQTTFDLSQRPSKTPRGTGSAADIASLYFGDGLPAGFRPIRILDPKRKIHPLYATVYGSGYSGGKLQPLTDLPEMRSARAIVRNWNFDTIELEVIDEGRAVCRGDSGGPVVGLVEGVPTLIGISAETTGDIPLDGDYTKPMCGRKFVATPIP